MNKGMHFFFDKLHIKNIVISIIMRHIKNIVI